MHHRARVLCLALLAPFAQSCVTGFDVAVKDPREVEVREPLTGVTVVPRGAPTASQAPDGGRARLTRRADGSLVLTTSTGREETILSAGGLVTGRASSYSVDDRELSAMTTIVRRGSPRSREQLELVTPRSNVAYVQARERENDVIGYTLLGSGALWIAAAGLVLFAPGLKVGKGDERRPITPAERRTLGWVFGGLGVGVSVAGGVVIARGERATTVVGPSADP
ncbi:MAG: hypothetical protein IT374_16755 [Polyangiaceae bacterium]|nr:hypothetical protein [Polyangiaceae bacterium]